MLSANRLGYKMAVDYEALALKMGGSIMSDDGLEALALQMGGTLSSPSAQRPSATGEFGSMDSSAEIPGLEQPYPARQPAPAPANETDAFTMTPAGPVRKDAGDTLVAVAETGAAMATGATTGMGGQVRGSLMQLASEIGSGQFGTAEAAKRIQQAAEQLGAENTFQPRTAQGQEMTQAVGEFAAQGAAFTPMMGAVPRVGPIRPATDAAGNAVRRGANAVADAPGNAVRRAGELVGESGLGQIADDVGAAVNARGVAKDAGAVRLAQAEPYNIANAEIMVQGTKGAERIVPDTLATAATKQGWKPGVVAAIKAGSDLDRAKGIQMINRYKAGQVNELDRSTRRPSDVIGQTIDSRIKFLIDAKNSSGKEIDRVSRTVMKDQPIESALFKSAFESDLADLGINIKTVVKDGRSRQVVSLKGSQIENDKGSTETFNIVLDRLDRPMTALRAHELKKFLDTEINYGARTTNAMKREGEQVIKDLRRTIKQSLGEQFPSYKAANEKYSDSIGALDDLQKGVGTSINLDSANAASALGTASRKLTSNYATRVNLMDSLELLDQVAKKHGMKINDSVMNQVIMANEIDRMFGATADTSLKGVMQQVERGVDIARGGALTAALELAKEGIDKSRGINQANAIKSIEALLRRKMEAEAGSTLPAEQP